MNFIKNHVYLPIFKNFFSVSFIMLFFLQSVAAQFTLNGKISHLNDNEAVIGAAVFITELRTGATTDINGNYRIANIPKGIYTLQISYIGHRQIVQKISIMANQSKDFGLENSGIAMEEVIVSGSSTKTLIKESPIPISALSKIQWLQGSSTNLVDAVGKLPGMSQISTGVGLSKPVIRGLGFNRVITMHDGIRQEDNQWGEEHSLHIDEYSVDRYEIIRGAGSLMYGSDGLGGVMSVLSARPVEEGKILGNAITNYQTNNGLLGISAMLAGNKKGFVWMGRVSNKNAGNYQNKYDGRVYGSNFKEFDVNGMVGVAKNWGFSRLYFSSFNQDINIVDGLRDAQGRFLKTIIENDKEKQVAVSQDELSGRAINEANTQKLNNTKISLNNYISIGKHSLTANLSYALNQRREYANVFLPNVPDLYFYLQTYYYDIRFNLAEKNGWETSIGTNGMYQTMQNKGSEVLYPNFGLLDNGIFVFTKKSFERLKLSGGLRFDSRKLSIKKLYIDADGKFQTLPQNAIEERFGGFEKTFANVTASFGGVYDLSNRLKIKANAGRGFRAPSVPEISSNGEHAGTFRYEIGNINQKSEVAFQTDLGLVYETKGFYLDLNVFQNSINNYSYSERVQSQGKDLFIGGVPVYRYQQGNARLRGIEASMTINPKQMRWFSFSQNYSLVRGQNLSAKNDSGRYLPFMPSPRWISQLKASRDRWGKRLRNTYAQIELEVYEAQNQALLANNTETPTPAYKLWNLGFGGDIVANNKTTLFSVYVSAQNLFDLAYQNHQNRLKYLDLNPVTGRQGIYNMGRNLSIKVVIPIGF